jgi:DNA-binding NtrC family response regulator
MHTEQKVPLSVVVVDDEPGIRSAVHRYLGKAGCDVRAFGSISEAKEALTHTGADLALFDYALPDGTGADLARWAILHRRVGQVVCMTGETGPTSIIDAMRAGFADVILKPFELTRLDELIAGPGSSSREMREWRRTNAPDLFGADPRLLDVFDVIRSVADTRSTVLITGETGTGKELVARAVHQGSARRSGPFVPLNCAAIPESLIEAELFGHTRGAFTGAMVAREGRIAAANGGTLFLDEIGDMPLSAQAKLLRVLQDKEIVPVGSDRSMPVDIRVVAATHRDLEAMVEEGTFRADLFFRLSVIRIELPPLRERKGDIVPLANRFLEQANAATGRNVSAIDAGAAELLRDHDWKGNVRELYNVVERAVVFKRSGVLTASDLKLAGPRGAKATHTGTRPYPAPTASGPISLEQLNLKSAVDVVERNLIRTALEKSNGNRTEAAALLGLNRTTLVEKLRKLSP